MLSLVFLTTLACFNAALAQSTNIPLELAGVEANFKQAELVPSLLPAFDPSALLTINYPGVGDVTSGQHLTKDQTSAQPTVTITPANSSVSLSGKFTIAMVDADIVGSANADGVNRHWLLNGVEVTDSKVSNVSATAITAYAGPGPAAGSGPHRYVIILYQQPDSFAAPADLSQPIGVTRMDLGAYVKDSGLGSLVAANYITVEEGTATVSIPATSSVVSSTLAPASSGTVSGTGTTSGSAAQPSKSNGAYLQYGFTALFAPIVGFVVITLL
jgi:phosphatidylethanolamine-binding protein (PEBP) family uncharacterized protein